MLFCVKLRWTKMCVAYFAPDDPVLRSLLLCLGFVNVCYSLAKVEVCLWLAGNTVNLDQRGVVCLVGLAPVKHPLM